MRRASSRIGFASAAPPRECDVSNPSRTPPNLPVPISDLMQDFLQVDSGAGQDAPTNLPVPISDLMQDFLQVGSGAGQDAPTKEPHRLPVGRNDTQAADSFTSEVVAALKEVVDALDSPEMATFFARSYAQGSIYNGPMVSMERLRSLIAKAEERGFLPRRAA